MRVLLAILLTMALSLLAAPRQAEAADWLEATVAITDKGFDPPILTVPLNTRVTWINQGSVVRSSTDDRLFWDSGGLAPPSISPLRARVPGHSFSYLFTTYDVWTYHSGPDALWVGGVKYTPLQGAIVVTGTVTEPTGKLPLPKPTPEPEFKMPPNTVLVLDSQYYPDEIAIKAGDTLTWTNYGGNVHTVTDDARMHFDSGGLAQPQQPAVPSSTFSYRFTKRAFTPITQRQTSTPPTPRASGCCGAR